ncbi:MAG: ATP F0F1 synthase subunit C [Mycoplasmatales bacterium]
MNLIAAGLFAIGAGIAIQGAGNVGRGQGEGTKGALEAIGRNPEAANDIRSTMFIGLGITESAAIYALLIAGAILGIMVTMIIPAV